MLYEDEWGIVDDGGGVGLVDGPATAFVCTLFMAANGQPVVSCLFASIESCSSQPSSPACVTIMAQQH